MIDYTLKSISKTSFGAFEVTSYGKQQQQDQIDNDKWT